jgi:hypothetical protein
METIVIASSKNTVGELHRSKTRQELSINKTADDYKKDSTLVSSNSHHQIKKNKKMVKFDMQKLEVVKIESFKKYNAENVFDDTHHIGPEKENYHCKCILY